MNNLTFPTSQEQKKIVSLLRKIFNREVEILPKGKKKSDSCEFYFVHNNDKSVRFILPKKNGCHLLSYLSPSTNHSKIILLLLKILYKLRLFGFMPSTSLYSINGLRNIRWSKYGWIKAQPPNVFIMVGTEKRTQNALLFLDDSHNLKNTLIVKVSINKLSNLKNEYNVGRVMEANSTQYVRYNSEENFLTQNYYSGYRKVIDLNNRHVDYLAGLVLKKHKKSGSEVKRNILNIFNSIDEEHKLCFPDLKPLLETVKNTSLFYRAHSHGDFAPYNIIYKKNSKKFIIIDWENADLDGLALNDLFNYVYIKDCLFSKNKSPNIDSFLYLMSQNYFLKIDAELNLEDFYQYKIIIIIREFLLRLKDAGSEDVYVKYLYELIRNENEKKCL